MGDAGGAGAAGDGVPPSNPALGKDVAIKDRGELKNGALLTFQALDLAAGAICQDFTPNAAIRKKRLGSSSLDSILIDSTSLRDGQLMELKGLELESVKYPEEETLKKVFTQFPFQKDYFLLAKIETLKAFLHQNSIQFSDKDSKELIFYKIKDFLMEKVYSNCKCSQDKDSLPSTPTLLDETQDSPTRQELPVEEEKVGEETVEEGEPDTYCCISDEMLLKLPPESAALFIDMKEKKKAELYCTLLNFGAEVDQSMCTSKMLSVFFTMLDENSRAETGIVTEQQGPVFKKKKKTTKDDPLECCVCMENIISVYLKSCGHAALCSDCSSHVKICPICRSPTENATLPLYFS